MNNFLSIYIHYPFCKSKCPYCDFNSHVKKEVEDDIFAQAYLKEIEYFASRLKNRKVKTIFFGGGTPSLMPISLLEKILGKINQIWGIDSKVEITLEANPTSFEAKKFADFKAFGVNRLSLGIQALNDNDLKFLGREHSASEAISTIKEASKIFDNYSFDLIYSRPNQTLESWQKELNLAFELAASHLSLYQLTIEKGTKFYSMFKNKEFILPSDDLAADLYELTNQVTAQNGLELYEISNYAKMGYESLHNLAYWKSLDYIGIGAGAHSRVTFDGDILRSQIMMIHNPKSWQDKAMKDGFGVQDIGFVEKSELLEEIILMGLRLKEGINNEVFLRYFAKNFTELFDCKKLLYLMEEGLIFFDSNHVYITDKGRILTNQIILKILQFKLNKF